MRTSDPRLTVKMETANPSPLGPEVNPSFWNPGLFGIRLAPEDFRSKLKAIDETLEACWNGETCKWQVFARTPRVNSPICRGWRLLFIVEDQDGQFLPLDERALATAWARSGYKWGDSAKYFDAIKREALRQREQAEQADKDESDYVSGDLWEHAYRPRVGYGPISASKVVGQ